MIYVSAHLLKISNCKFELIHKKAVSKTARKKLDNKVAQTGEVITVRDIYAKTSKLKEDKFAKTIKIYERIVAVEQKKK